MFLWRLCIVVTFSAAGLWGFIGWCSPYSSFWEGAWQGALFGFGATLFCTATIRGVNWALGAFDD